MKNTLSLAALAATLLTVGTTAFAQMPASSSSAPSCGPNNIRCMSGYVPQCSSTGTWQCVATSSSSSSSSVDSCIAACPDGHQYRTCTEDGHPINYFADPCLGHYSSSSSSSAPSCGPSAILCPINAQPVCKKDGSWSCESTSQATVKIDSLNPPQRLRAQHRHHQGLRLRAQREYRALRR